MARPALQRKSGVGRCRPRCAELSSENAEEFLAFLLLTVCGLLAVFGLRRRALADIVARLALAGALGGRGRTGENRTALRRLGVAGIDERNDQSHGAGKKA